MAHEQEQRFQDMRVLVDEAQKAMKDLTEITNKQLTHVNNDSPDQAEQLQRIQQCAGTVVQTTTQIADIARHARSYQAQAHSRHSTDVPH